MTHHAARRPVPSPRLASGTLIVALVLGLALGVHAETCADPAGTPCTSDGNRCTTDECDGSGTCVHTNNNEPCNDGFFCNGVDTCRHGTCSVHGGNPCAGAGECANTCNEAAETCFTPVGTPCTSDGNDCTDDRCNAEGRCAHPANGAPCSSGLANAAGVEPASSD